MVHLTFHGVLTAIGVGRRAERRQCDGTAANSAIIGGWSSNCARPMNKAYLIGGPTLLRWRSMGREEDRLFIAMIVLAWLATVALTAVVVFSL